MCFETLKERRLQKTASLLVNTDFFDDLNVAPGSRTSVNFLIEFADHMQMFTFAVLVQVKLVSLAP